MKMSRTLPFIVPRESAAAPLGMIPAALGTQVVGSILRPA
jgi:hypothetical protein